MSTSKVVTTVFDEILAAVHDGRLLPGQRISDADIAEEFGVSRTPVREALQRLREIGIVEASPGRFTRISDVTPRQTLEALIVWLALYRAVIAEVVPTASAEIVDAMRADNAAFLHCIEVLDTQGIARTNMSFFSHLVTASTNPTLQRAVTSVVHVVRLGSLHLPDYIDFAALATSQQLLIDAADTRNAALALAALHVIQSIEIPQEEPSE